MKIPSAESCLQAVTDKDCAFASFLPTVRCAPGSMCQEKSSIGAGIWRQPHPAESGLRCRVLKERRVAAENLIAELKQIDPPGICMAGT
ncbi:MAG: hypothetical protein P8X68_09465 [Desulfobacterales bacterium]|jgi:hypothetical protein